MGLHGFGHIGLDNIEARVRALTTRLIEEAGRRQLRIRTPIRWDERAGIVSIDLGRHCGEVVAKLKAQGVIVSEKDGHLRVSVHIYNNEEDIEQYVMIFTWVSCASEPWSPRKIRLMFAGHWRSTRSVSRMTALLLHLRGSRQRTRVLDGVSFGVDKGQIVSLIGPSGSGKSTVLRVLMGLLPPIAGHVSVGGARIDYSNRAQLRDIRNRFAVVFQQYNLFQNMCALDNVTVAPVKVQRRPRREAEAVALLERVGLADKIRDYPDELSGGQQQRVAIARALALKPEVLLLDEVTASLDPELVSDVLDAIRGLAEEGMTMLIVSHEMGFVREISAKVVFMAEGKVVEQGPPEAVFDDPRQTRTREFVSKILKH